jgi:hypothetical protein
MSEDHWSDRLMLPALVLAWWGVLFPVLALIWPAATAPYLQTTDWLVGGFAALLAMVTVVELALVRRVPEYEARLARKRKEWSFGQQFLSGDLAEPRLLLVNRVAMAGLVVLTLFFDEAQSLPLFASFAISTLMMMLDLKNRFLAD